MVVGSFVRGFEVDQRSLPPSGPQQRHEAENDGEQAHPHVDADAEEMACGIDTQQLDPQAADAVTDDVDREQAAPRTTLLRSSQSKNTTSAKFHSIS